MSTLNRWASAGLFALLLSGALTLWPTRTHQPDPNAEFQAYAEYITRDSFLVDHLAGSIAGSALAILGVMAQYGVLSAGRASRWGRAGLVSSIVGNTLILTLFGVAAFASPALGRAYLAGQTEVVALNEAISGIPLLITGVIGVLFYGAGAIFSAVDLWRSGVFPRWTAILYAASGPLIGLFGLMVGEAQTLGAALLIASTLWLALTVARQGAPPFSNVSTPDESVAPGRRQRTA